MGQQGGDAGRTWLVGAVVLGLLVLVAVVMPDGAVLVGDTDTDRVVVPDLPLVGEYLLVAVWLAMVIAWLVLRSKMLPVRGFGIQREQRSRWPFWVSLALFALVWALSPSIRDGLSELLDRANPFNDAPDTGGAATNARPDVESSRPLGLLVTLGMTGVLAFMIVMTIRVLGGRSKPAQRSPREMLVSEVDASIDDLFAIGDPRSAVIACFSRMRKLAAIAGTTHDAADTPYEFVERMLIDQAVASEKAHRLTELFERARFSEHPIDEFMRIEALDALTEIRTELVGIPV